MVSSDVTLDQQTRTVRAEKMKKVMDKKFFKKGISIALFSGIAYGIYTALLTMGMTKGVWAEWYGENSPLSAFVIVYVLGALANAINDSCSAFWALLNAIYQGKFGDFLRCLKTKPGRTIVVAAFIGGPIAGTAYVVALQMAGSLIVPISALCPAIAAILARILYKQEISKRMALGILICVFASFLIGSTGFSADGISMTVILGIIIAIGAALGWGFEGCVAGYASAMVDPQIGICIRQLASGLANLFIVLPILGLMSGRVGLSFELVAQAFTSAPAMSWFIVSGLITFLTFMTWYQGNSMCGVGLGSACNGTYSFFGPFFCYLVLGVYAGIDGWSLPTVAWIGAVIMMLGILIISVNPLEFFAKKEEEEDVAEVSRPLNYAILHYFTTVEKASVNDIMEALKEEYSDFKAFTKPAIINAVMTAEQNGLVEQVNIDLDKNEELEIFYHMNDEAKETIYNFIGK